MSGCTSDGKKPNWPGLNLTDQGSKEDLPRSPVVRAMSGGVVRERELWEVDLIDVLQPVAIVL
jgi:hypothetical protein